MVFYLLSLKQNNVSWFSQIGLHFNEAQTFVLFFLPAVIVIFLTLALWKWWGNCSRLTGCGYMQAGFPNIIRKTLSIKTNCLMKRIRMIHSCLHIAAVVCRAVFPSSLSSVFLRFLPFQHFVLWSVLFRFFPFHCKVDFFILFYCFLICLVFIWNLKLSRFQFIVIQSFWNCS